MDNSTCSANGQLCTGLLLRGDPICDPTGLKGSDLKWVNSVLHMNDAEKHADIILAGCVLHSW